MISKRQIAANRANAAKSTGPRTAQGKARSAQNAVSHGLCSVSPVLDDEDLGNYEVLKDRFFKQFRPATPLEEELVADLVDIQWRLGRIVEIEASIFERADWEERISAARADARRADPARERLRSLVGIASDEDRVAQEQVEAVQAAARKALSMSASGYLRDAMGPNLIERLGRYETRLENRRTRVLKELERQQDQRMAGEIVDITPE